MSGQTSIEGDRPGSGAVAGQGCEWCPEPATTSFPIMRRVRGGKPGAALPTGQYVYACASHEDVARRSTAEPRKAL